MEYIYIAPYHLNIMLKALLTVLPQPACVVLHLYYLSISTLEHTVPLAVDYTRSRSWYYLTVTVEAHLMPGFPFYHLGGVKCVARGLNIL